MNTTTASKLAFATLVAPVLTALAVGLGGTAHAESPNSSGGTATASDTISQLQEQGMRVIVNKTGTGPMAQCSVISVRQDRHQHHGGQQRNEFSTAYVDINCR